MAAATPKMIHLESLPCLYPNAAALDIGSAFIVAAIPPDRDERPVRAFGTMTPDLNALVAWLCVCGIDTVAMESTGVYGIPIYELLEPHGILPILVNAHHVKMVPGRKTDGHDAPWLQTLHTFGLLHASFRPDAERCRLRTLLRHRAELIRHRAPHIGHLQQALQQMNMQLERVLTDVMGTTGLALLRAIVAGERDAVKLAQLRNPACTSSTEAIAKALTGTWCAEHVFVMQQALDLYDTYTTKLAACDEQIEPFLSAMQPRSEVVVDTDALPPAKPNAKAQNRPKERTRAQLARILGVDLVAITGLSAARVQTIISEVGTDMGMFPTVKHFCSWLGLAPHNDISGGRVLHSHTRKVTNRATQAFRMAAQSVTRTDTALGAYFRAMRAKRGPQQAIVATAHKLARIVYHMLVHRTPFREERAEEHEERRRARERKQLVRRAQKLGYELTRNGSPSAELTP